MKQAVLLVKDIEQDEELFLSELGEETCLGKSAHADVQIQDWKCNGIHALIKNTGKGEFELIDLGSSFGTYVDNQMVQQSFIQEGQEFKIGNNQFTIRSLTSAELKKLKPSELNTEHAAGNSDIVLASDKNILEVTMYWGDKLLEMQQFKAGSQISIGNPKYSTFPIPEELLPSDKSETFLLSTYKKGSLRLFIPEMANGIIWTGNQVYNLDAMRMYDEKYMNRPFIDLSLRVGDRASVEFGELIFSYRFIAPAKRIAKGLLPKIEKQTIKMLGGILAFYLLIFGILSLYKVEEKEVTIKDIPKHLKKVAYNIGIKNAKKVQQAAIGAIAKTLEGGRARSEEGKSSARKAPEKQPDKSESKDQSKVKKAEKKAAAKTTAQKSPAKKEVKLDLDKTFSDTSASQVSSSAALVSNVRKSGNTASALGGKGFARGVKGLGAGGGGESVGIGALKGRGSGGGMGAGDYGLSPSKGREIEIAEEQDVKIEGGLDPETIARIIKRYLPQIQYCYEQQLVKKPHIKGKVTVNFVITAQGAVTSPKLLESTLQDSPTENCILGKIKNWKFPKPRGGGTVGVKYPFILMSNNSK